MSLKYRMSDEGKVIFSIFVLLSFIPLITFSGFVITKMWLWFIVPIFGVEPLSIPMALGLATIVGYLTHQVSLDTEVDKERYVERYMVCLLRPFLVLFVSWVLTFFM